MGSSSSKPTKYYDDFEANLPTLSGKTVVITGCTSGTGLIAAKCSVRKGAANVLMLNRTSERATKAEQEVRAATTTTSTTTNVETIPCDLQDFDSVRKAVETIKSKFDSIDVLCNNAGVMALEDKATKDGYDIQMQTNHLSHFLLTKKLYPLLKNAANKNGEARIVNHSSMARSGSPLKPEYFGKNGGNLGGNGNSMVFNGARWERYHQSKLANATMTLCLADKLKAMATTNNVKSVCAAPGFAQTNLQVTTSADGGLGSTWFMRLAQSGEDGTMGLVHACFGLEVANGTFWEPKNGMWGVPVRKDLDKHCLDKDQQTMLWEKSEEACGKFDV